MIVGAMTWQKSFSSVFFTVPLRVAKKTNFPSCSRLRTASMVRTVSPGCSATRLPTIDPVYLIVTPPSGSSSVTPVPVSSTGTWSGIESSGLAGTWTYTFSGLQTNNTYGAVATCSAHVI